VDRAELSQKLDRLVTHRLSSTGMASEYWAEMLGAVDRKELMRAVVACVKIIVPDWQAENSNDERPKRAVEAAEAWLASPSEEAVKHAKEVAKACTAARNETFGRGHRVPEAAREVAKASGALEKTHLFDALEAVEAELLARVALVGEYARGPEQRKLIVETLRAVLVPKIVEEPKAAAAVVDSTPVPYAASGHFVVGQRIDHKKFGLVNVVAAQDNWIEVALPDGTTKRLTHKPA
jgi:hypothetical protein